LTGPRYRLCGEVVTCNRTVSYGSYDVKHNKSKNSLATTNHRKW